MDPVGYLNFIDATKYNDLDKQIIEEMTAKWRETPLDIVMDLGCGLGNNSTIWIDKCLPNITRLIGIDNDPKMIALAKERNAKEKVEFHVADIMEKHTLKEWKGGVDRIVSMFVLHRVRDQKTAFKNVFDLLKSSGKAALFFCIDGPYYDTIMDLMKIPKWKTLLESTNFIFPEAYIKKYDIDHYKKMFEDLGFAVNVCKQIQEYFVWESDIDCKNFLMCLHSIDIVTTQVKEEFAKDIFDQYQKHSSRNSEGKLDFCGSGLYAELHKATG